MVFNYLVIYSTDNKLRFYLNKFCQNEIGYKNHYGWEIIAIYYWYDHRFVKESDVHRLIAESNERHHKRFNRITKLIDILETIRNAL